MTAVYQPIARLLPLSARAVGTIVLRRSRELADCSDTELGDLARSVRWQLRERPGSSSLRIETFAVVASAIRRVFGFEPYGVQIRGGWQMSSGRLVEMQTGEGKTITALLPAAFHGSFGRGCHVATANDYLAERDADEMGPVFRMLGLSVGCVREDMSDDDRRTAYHCDVTYGTGKEMGFDFLRDCLKRGPQSGDAIAPIGVNELPVQREHYFALVDEADSVLLDEARTPLVIAGPPDDNRTEETLRHWADSTCRNLEPQRDFVIEAKKRSVELTDAGCRRVTLTARSASARLFPVEQLFSAVETALVARHVFVRDRDYIVNEQGEVEIIDLSTGRRRVGSRWQEGLHQAVEAKEKLVISADSTTSARVTIQSYFRRYRHLAGMTGTAMSAKLEFQKTYRLRTCSIPTHRPSRRVARPTRVFIDAAAKCRAIADETQTMIESGRPVLIGTPSVEASELVAAALSEAGIVFSLLHARRDDVEAEIVAAAGQASRVTVATNMAGRGTDIRLEDSVKSAGGLHVIATERHASGRVDRQLVGRAGRQGDPGTFRFVLSLDDELLHRLGSARIAQLKRMARPDAHGELRADRWEKLFLRTQARIERRDRKQRAMLLKSETKSLAACERMGIDPNLEWCDL
ncbi:preprotein translocase subunit SecA [Stratiformator vulcanicus]|uniref:Protein translocase subunit SecA n=1 Tax=Stratiformator vulcanicus TaxID=2527980 RepID=A0A517QZ79_9PLAN|nr:translocase [Stratiformator vulcanicus]QDT36949.1 preprotein translocase subunit SecA [Stratiformator vulcanicus]